MIMGRGGEKGREKGGTEKIQGMDGYRGRKNTTWRI